jgi:hypothetical protein
MIVKILSRKLSWLEAMLGLWFILHSEAPSSELNTEDGIGGACGTYVGELQWVEVFFLAGEG